MIYRDCIHFKEIRIIYLPICKLKVSKKSIGIITDCEDCKDYKKAVPYDNNCLGIDNGGIVVKEKEYPCLKH